MRIAGTAWVFVGPVSATDIVSARYDRAGMSRDWEECRKHLFEELRPDLSTSIAAGDVFIAGGHLGMGHAHYYTAAIMTCKAAGLVALLCDGINALFQRCAIDLGLLAWSIPGTSLLARTGEQVEIDFTIGQALNRTTGLGQVFEPVSPLILDIVAAGGSLEWAVGRVGSADRRDVINNPDWARPPR